MASPVYSHGGPSMQGFPAIPGTADGAGNPIYIIEAQVNPALNIFWSGTGVTVLVEGNGGAIDPTTGLPPAGEWVDYSAGGYAMVNGDFLSKSLPRAIPCWRTRMTLTVLGPGTGLTSYVPCIVTPNGLFVSAGRPTTSANAYNPNSNP